MRRLLALVLALAAPACGGSATPAPPAPSPPPAAPSPAPRAEAPPDLSPVARPEHVIGIGRASREVALELARMSDSEHWAPWRARAIDLERWLDERAPVELMVAVEPRPAGPVPEAALVVSAGIASLKDALSALTSSGAEPERAGRGVWRIGASHGHCALAAAVGTSPARLVCASSPDFLEQLVPYAVRGLPKEPARHGADAWLALDVARFRALYGERLKSLERWALPFAGPALAAIDPRLDRALGPLLGSIYGELMAVLDDANEVLVTAQLTPGELDLGARVTLGRAPSSTLIGTLLEAGKHQAPPPADFWKLPADARFAFYSHGMPAARAELLRSTLRGALSRGASTPVPKQTLELVVDALFPEPAFVYAGGMIDALAYREPTLGERIRRRTELVLGWHVLGVEAADTAALGRRLDAGMNDYNRGPLRKAVYGEVPRLCEGMPRITRRAAPKDLPKGSLVYEMILPGKLFDDCAQRSGYGSFGATYRPRGAKPPATASLSIAVVFVPAKPRSWIVVSPVTDSALDRMRAVLSGGQPTLKPPPGFERPSVFGLLADRLLLAPRPLRPWSVGEHVRLTASTSERAFELSISVPRSAVSR